MRRRSLVSRLASAFAATTGVRGVAGAIAIVGAVVCVPETAHAEVTSWLSAGSGYSVQKNAVSGYHNQATPLSFAVGVGSTPDASFVIGGIFRSTTYIGLGTDLSIGPRFATGGFARGDWGVAVDVGVTGRYWGGGDFAKYPFDAMLLLGAPYGFQLGLGANFASITGDPQGQGFTGLIEIDLLRLTVMRRGSTEKSWPNPMPATAPDPASLHSVVE